MTYYDGPKPIAIGHLSDSGDLKIWNNFRTGYICTHENLRLATLSINLK